MACIENLSKREQISYFSNLYKTNLMSFEFFESVLVLSKLHKQTKIPKYVCLEMVNCYYNGNKSLALMYYHMYILKKNPSIYFYEVKQRFNRIFQLISNIDDNIKFQI